MSSVLNVSQRVLCLPIRNGAPEKTFRLIRDNEIVRSFIAAPAVNEPPDWMAFCDLDAFVGQTLCVTVDDREASDDMMSLLQLHDEPKGFENLYRRTVAPPVPFFREARLVE